ncbi:McrB family protein [Aromatoleum anaerobium]|uniref:AAA domain-containing protein n=1 Tax=Aromatoleum anaerobium TaxID=182180 RepID=A0ABX1PPK4_9RHOO|nr:AAA family ATPase [Aromatoleum anaerobium]MCK0507275.1 AAA family ATPase [Aromatoleum anaerobium]
MASDLTIEHAFDVTRGDRSDQEPPSLTWSEADLRKYLAREWDQYDPAHIRVIGRLRLAEAESFGFLEELHHAETGTRLGSPLGNSRVHQRVFVPASEIKDLQNRWGTTTYTVAELDLSPLEERRKRGDPFACKVRRGTLVALSHTPESWGIRSIDSESVPLLVEIARQAIDERLADETAEANEKLCAARSMLEEVASEKQLLGDEVGRLKREVSERMECIEALNSQFMHRRDALEIRVRELEALLRERGERMIALDLVDKADLEKVFPHIGKPDERKGHCYGEVIAGNFQRLASYIQTHLWHKGIRYTRAQLLDFITLLRTNDLIVLAGDSGSGKSSLVKAVAAAVGGRCTIVPVKPNWTGSDDLLGYYNPIERRYHPSQFLLALLEAAREPEIPHFICLDEMNLARVEYYFADFLSLLETRGEAPWIHLYSAAEERQAVIDNKIFLALEEEARRRAGLPGDASFNDILMHDEANLELRRLAGFQEADTLLNHHAKIRRAISGLIDIPAGFRFPSNVWIIGAINVDETTHYLSPKILDRAHIMRFRNPVLLDWDEVEGELEEFELDLGLPMKLLATDIGTREEYPNFDQADPHVRLLVGLARNYLDPLGVEFGLRAIRQSLNYIRRGEEAEIGAVTALNNVVLHKILPKIILDVEKVATNGQKRRNVLISLRDSLAQALDGLDQSKVTESAVEALDQLIARSEGNNGIANFWAR